MDLFSELCFLDFSVEVDSALVLLGQEVISTMPSKSSFAFIQLTSINRNISINKKNINMYHLTILIVVTC